MKIIYLLAGLALFASCDKGGDEPKPEPKPPVRPKPPIEQSGRVFYYLPSGEKLYFDIRKDRVIIQTASFEYTMAMSALDMLQFGWDAAYGIGEWVFGAIDSMQTNLSDVIALPGALDATYGLSGRWGTLYPTNQILFSPKAGFTAQQIFEDAGLSEYVIELRLINEYHDNYIITLDVHIGCMVQICRELHESGQIEWAEPNFYQ